jgi:hypothetical protein
MKGIPDPVEAEPDRKKTRVRQRTKQNYNNVVVKKTVYQSEGWKAVQTFVVRASTYATVQTIYKEKRKKRGIWSQYLKRTEHVFIVQQVGQVAVARRHMLVMKTPYFRVRPIP